MKLGQFVEPNSGIGHVGLVDGGEVIDLSQGEGAPRSVYDIYYSAGGDAGEAFDATVLRLAESAGAATDGVAHAHA